VLAEIYLMSRQCFAVTNRARCSTFSVATIAPTLSAWAARITSASRASGGAVGVPRLRACAQNSAARRMVGVSRGR
jgi:hypothetical protein